jgi:hypothetical protein
MARVAADLDDVGGDERGTGEDDGAGPEGGVYSDSGMRGAARGNQDGHGDQVGQEEIDFDGVAKVGDALGDVGFVLEVVGVGEEVGVVVNAEGEPCAVDQGWRRA